MCGICGMIHFDGKPIEESVLQKMVEVLHHRGPDGQGTRVDHQESISVGLGHTRLKVIDLEGSKQPLSNEDQSVWTVFNGEIYNFVTLRQQLQKRHQFKSQGDTEVLVHLYEEFGLDLLQQIEGMFAFCIYDQKNKRVILARDPVGKKPLYYYRDDQKIVFASELKSIFQNPSVPKEIRWQCLPLYLRYGYVPTPETFYERIFCLPPGHCLVVENNGKVQVHEYWSIRNPLSSAGFDSDWQTVLRGKIQESVSKRLISDVPLGAFLSGGIDSSVIVAEMSQMQEKPVSTYSIGFPGYGVYDETPYAKMIAQKFKTDHHHINVEPKIETLIEEVLHFHDQPFGDSSAIPTYILCNQVRKDLTVALSGDGGDELFGGYRRFQAVLMAQKIPQVFRKTGSFLSKMIAYGNYHSIRNQAHRFFEHSNAEPNELLMNFCKFFQDGDLEGLLNVNFHKDIGYRSGFYERDQKAFLSQDILKENLILNFETYLPEDLLVKMDRMSMANSLEVRSPFLDTQLAEYVFSLPSRLKVSGFRLKKALKEVYREIIPDEILDRPKRGFALPLGRWFREELKSYVSQVLVIEGKELSKIIRPEFIEKMLKEHEEGYRDYGQQIWLLLMLQIWLKRNS